MKRNAALLTAGMATVFVSTTAVAAVRVAQHGFTGTRPVVSKRSADPTSSTSGAPVAPVVVTRTEDETVFVVVPGASTTVPGTAGAGSVVVPKAIDAEVENEHEDAPATSGTTAASPAATPAPTVESDDADDANEPGEAAEHAAQGATTASTVERSDDQVRTGGGKGGGLEDGRFPGGGDD